jgi:hypothetical protein
VLAYLSEILSESDLAYTIDKVLGIFLESVYFWL